ncbi:MAG: hypothetical protein H0X73_11780 [Chthoniobacterales bacterium]|nr:hypothetical protein [Chthoniobacterales bacterium]
MAARRPRSLVFAIDIGSSSVRTALFTQSGARLPATFANRRYAIRYSPEGAAELDPMVLLRAARACTRETLLARSRSTALNPLPITAGSGSAFWHALLGVDQRNRPITPVFTWADSRSARDAADLRRKIDERDVQTATGCMLRAQFWPAKLRWLRRTNRSLFRQAARWTAPACWIFDDVFGVGDSSHSMASASGMYNLASQDWDEGITDLCDLHSDKLDTIRDSAVSAKRRLEFRDARIFTAIGDGAASNLGSGTDRQGVVAISFGTSGAVRMLRSRAAALAQQLPFGLFQYVVDARRLVIGGAISNAGNLREWCVREFHLPHEQQALSRTAAAHDTLIVLPFLVSERAPDWPETLRGTIMAVTQTTTAADLLRASVTSSFYRLAEILELMVPKPRLVKEVIVSGGILHSMPSLHILADCLARDIRISRELESSLRGAAIYALQALGHTVAPLPAGKLLRHDRALAKKHRQRRTDQRRLQSLLQQAHRQEPGDAALTPPRAHRSSRQACKRSSD